MRRETEEVKIGRRKDNNGTKEKDGATEELWRRWTESRSHRGTMEERDGVTEPQRNYGSHGATEGRTAKGW